MAFVSGQEKNGEFIHDSDCHSKKLHDWYDDAAPFH
jgi:hypothetical protein